MKYYLIEIFKIKNRKKNMKMTDEEVAIVFDNGSGICKDGFSGVSPSLIGRPLSDD